MNATRSWLEGNSSAMLDKAKYPRGVTGTKKRNRDVQEEAEERGACVAGVSGNSSDDNHSSQAQVQVVGVRRRKHSLGGEVEMKMPYPSSPQKEFRIDRPGTPPNSLVPGLRQKDYPSTPPPAPKKVHPNKNRRRKVRILSRSEILTHTLFPDYSQITSR